MVVELELVEEVEIPVVHILVVELMVVLLLLSLYWVLGVMAAALVCPVSVVTLRQVAVLVIQMMAQLGQLVLFLMLLELQRVLLVVAAVVLAKPYIQFVFMGLILELMAQMV
jgi:hypothetical protein